MIGVDGIKATDGIGKVSPPAPVSSFSGGRVADLVTVVYDLCQKHEIPYQYVPLVPRGRSIAEHW